MRIKLCLALSVLCLYAAGQVGQKQMKAHYFNVGQAASCLLEFPCGVILIDAGEQDKNSPGTVRKYLNQFFETRPDLNRTIDLVIVTHAHTDHDYGLRKVIDSFNVKRFIDNGKNKGSGRNQLWLQKNVGDLGIEYQGISFDKIKYGGNHQGLTSALIDPLHCDEVDPKVTLYSGGFKRKPASWTQTEFDSNGNDHSLVVKVEFGKSSFLFIGDMELAEMNTITNYYKNDGVLDADVLAVGHHGAENASTTEFLELVTPDIAVVSCGVPTYGTHATDNQLFNTYKYGHPRKAAIDLLQNVMTKTRPEPIQVKVATRSKKFESYTVQKNIYATAWDGSITITADDKAHYQIKTEQAN